MRLVMLIENTSASEKLFAEHGFSAYIEHAGGKYLIDAGAGGKFLRNAQRLRLEPEEISALCISHNHFDHAGGCEDFLEVNPKAAVFAKAAALPDTYYKLGPIKYPIGAVGRLYEKYSRNFILFKNFQEIAPNFFLMSNEIHDADYACQDKRLYRIRNENGVQKLQRDDYSHECFAVIFPEENKKKGCVIVSPCSHCGIVNIIQTVRKTWRDVPVLAVVAGFHTMGKSVKTLGCSEDYLNKTASELRSMGIGTVYTCHCTGIKAYNEMKRVLGDQLQYLQTGEEISF